MSEFILSRKAKDLTGQRIGSLIAIRPVGMDGRNVAWEFICDCGNHYTMTGAWVTAQHRKAINPLAPSCGCLNRLTTQQLRLKHGMSKHPLFWAWVAMIERCHNPNNPNFIKYGAKGVFVCDEWRKNSSAFIDWALANGWEKGLHLDKDILCHQKGLPPHYSPDTCQFISVSENSRSTKQWLSNHSSI